MTTEFQDFVKSSSVYVDKTLFIKEFMENEYKASCILRPRRFGKSLNLWMLQTFLSIGADQNVFSRFEIGKDKEFCEEHLGKYPVVRLDLKDCKGSSWDEMYSQLWVAIRASAKEHKATLIANNDPFELGKDRSQAPSDKAFVMNSLRLLTEKLFEINGKKVILLIDEYDTPLNSAARGNFFDKASQFFGGFFSQALKENSFLGKACLVGIVEIRGSGILSGLNNVKTYSVADPEFSKWFGFTEEELRDLLTRKFGNTDRLEGLMEWYNGYHIGNQLVMNPFSIVGSLLTEGPDFLRSFWIESSTSENLTDYIGPHTPKLLYFVAEIISEREYEVSALTTAVFYSQNEWNLDSIIHFLVLAGYLTYTDATDGDTGMVWIPNKEVRLEWWRTFELLLKTSYRKTDLPLKISSALKAANFTLLRDLMQEILYNFSYFDFPLAESEKPFKESLYHVLISTAFITAASEGECEVKYYRESGDCGYDLEYVDLKNNTAIVFEYKWSLSRDRLDEDARAALARTIEKRYLAYRKEYLRYYVGVAFYRKQVSNFAVHSAQPES